MVNFEGGADPDEYLTKYVVDRVNTTAAVYLGTTLACAECHDHKYDPFTQKDFYRFYAFFNTIDEKGLDGLKESPAPRLKVPTAEQDGQAEGGPRAGHQARRPAEGPAPLGRRRAGEVGARPGRDPQGTDPRVEGARALRSRLAERRDADEARRPLGARRGRQPRRGRLRGDGPDLGEGDHGAPPGGPDPREPRAQGGGPERERQLRPHRLRGRGRRPRAGPSRPARSSSPAPRPITRRTRRASTSARRSTATRSRAGPSPATRSVSIAGPSSWRMPPSASSRARP